ncbi:MAG: hypothetical protein ACQESR_08555 [Planctomycetota bacterium]
MEANVLLPAARNDAPRGDSAVASRPDRASNEGDEDIFQAVGFFRVESCPTQAVLPFGRTRGGESHPRPV